MKRKILDTAEAIHLSIEIWEYVVQFGRKPSYTERYLARCPMCHHFEDCQECRRIVNWSAEPMATMSRCDDPNDGLFYRWERCQDKIARTLYAKEILGRLKNAEMENLESNG